MDFFPNLLLGAGVLGMLFAISVGSVFAIVIPVWAALDVAASPRTSGEKTLAIILMIVFWGPAGFLYALLLTSSRALRMTTILSTVVSAVVGIVAMGSCLGGASMAKEIDEKKRERSRLEAEAQMVEAQRNAGEEEASAAGEELRAQAEARRAEQVAERAEEQAAAKEAVALGVDGAAASFEPFWAVSKSGAGTSWVKVTPAGFDPSSAKPLPPRVEDAVEMRGRMYALTKHDLGRVRGSKWEEIDTESMEEFSWPASILRTGKRELLVVTSHVYTNFIEFRPRSKELKLLGAVRGPKIHDAARGPEGAIWGLADTGRSLEKLYKFSPAGAVLRETPLKPKLPLERRIEHAQVAWSQGRVMLLVEEQGKAPQLYAVGPASGKLSRLPWKP